MDSSQTNTTIRSGESREYVEMDNIDEELLEKLYAMPPARAGIQKMQPTERQLKILIDLWPTRNKELVAKAIGVSPGVARRWYKEEMERRNSKS